MGIVALLRFVKSGSFRLMDALVVLFVLSFAISEILHEPIMNDGIFAAVGNFVSIVLAYVAGRQLIEPDLRFNRSPKDRYSDSLAWPYMPVPVDGAEFLRHRRKQNPETPDGRITTDIRSGHGKAGGAFMSSEIAGIAFGMTFALNAWLVFLKKRKIGENLGKRFSRLEKYHVPALLLVFYVVLTQERGPLIALAVVLLILQIPKFKRTKLVTGLVAVLLIVGAMGAKQYFDKYTDLQDYEYGSASEQSEEYILQAKDE